jgi:hypothetical protein
MSVDFITAALLGMFNASLIFPHHLAFIVPTPIVALDNPEMHTLVPSGGVKIGHL